MIRGSQQDELIFDYLEGNLSAEETEALQILQDESEVFDREVRLWQNSYLEAELPAIDDLENKLLIHAAPAQSGVAGGISRAMLILLAILVIPSARNEVVSELSGQSTYALSRPLQDETPEAPPRCPETMAPPRNRTDQHVHAADRVILVTSPVVLPELLLQPLVEPRKPRLPGIPINQAASGKTLTKKWSKRELRFIRKRRWQTIELRRESEFQKGRVPYVVPLNNNNF